MFLDLQAYDTMLKGKETDKIEQMLTAHNCVMTEVSFRNHTIKGYQTSLCYSSLSWKYLPIFRWVLWINFELVFKNTLSSCLHAHVCVRVWEKEWEWWTHALFYALKRPKRDKQGQISLRKHRSASFCKEAFKKYVLSENTYWMPPIMLTNKIKTWNKINKKS